MRKLGVLRKVVELGLKRKKMSKLKVLNPYIETEKVAKAGDRDLYTGLCFVGRDRLWSLIQILLEEGYLDEFKHCFKEYYYPSPSLTQWQYLRKLSLKLNISTNTEEFQGVVKKYFCKEHVLALSSREMSELLTLLQLQVNHQGVLYVEPLLVTKPSKELCA